MQGRSSSLVVHSSLNVNFWIASPPSTEAARPACCPRCRAASRPPGRPLGLVGHGWRERQLRGPAAPNEAPSTRVVFVRRYRCRACEAIVTVVPRQVLAGRHFAAGAIALALFVFGKLGATAAAAAARIGSCACGPGAWRTLRRWLSAIETGRLFPGVRGAPPTWSPRQRAERTAMTIAARMPAVIGATEVDRVFAGAAFAT